MAPHGPLPCAICLRWIPGPDTGPAKVWLDPRADHTPRPDGSKGGAFVAHPACWARFEPFQAAHCAACGGFFAPVNTVSSGRFRLVCITCKREYEVQDDGKPLEVPLEPPLPNPPMPAEPKRGWFRRNPPP
jgi:hypothetical protein